ncbi:hypothetical protein ACS0TY_004246 [Phlomoides rotata]
MEYNNDGSPWPPMCWCKTGQMVLLQAGTERKPGRYFYRCPRNVKHPRSFIWCDAWHQHDLPTNRPDFLKFQNPNLSYYSSQVSSSCMISSITNPVEVSGILSSLSTLKTIIFYPFRESFNTYFYVGCLVMVAWSLLIGFSAYCYGRVSR